MNQKIFLNTWYRPHLVFGNTVSKTDIFLVLVKLTFQCVLVSFFLAGTQYPIQFKGVELQFNSVLED